MQAIIFYYHFQNVNSVIVEQQTDWRFLPAFTVTILQTNINGARIMKYRNLLTSDVSWLCPISSKGE